MSNPSDGYNVELPLGQNNSNNAYNSSNVTGNRDGSVLERLEDLKEGIGETTDFADHETLLGYNNSLYQHQHKSAKCYPTLANGVVVTGGTGVWTLGNFAEIIPINTITNAFDVHWVNFESVSANDVYEFVLYAGVEGEEVEIGRCRTYKTSTASGSNSVRIQIPKQSPNTRISAKLASSSGGDSATVSLFYHEYS